LAKPGATPFSAIHDQPGHAIARSNAPQIPFHLFVAARENEEQGVAFAPENQPKSQTNPAFKMPSA
jgi:hypothetical protein